MIFRHRTESSAARGFPRGFTLLEIVMVLAISALVIGGSITMLVISSSERVLRNTSGEIELLAKKARSAAILRQTPHAIEFHPGFVRLVPLALSGDTERFTAMGNEIGGTASDPDMESEPLREEIEIGGDVELSVRRWNSGEYLVPTETLVPVWRFDPDGLSEPLTVRLAHEESYAEDTYHPLTATISESELEAR